ncbi:dihydropteroate synthase [Actinomyces sp. B33]|nr:dihydropteroate synthase [Actinomyces sp. B33]MDC4233519.1 dihydropteroate synthase [Actinomyces sp. B33]
MGILNVTPDSFSDGGRWADASAALHHARGMTAVGADLVDVGGESTRPGSTRIDSDEEWARIGGVVGALADSGVVVSVDTLHADTAARAARAGAAIINDVSGGMWDPAMNDAVAGSGCAYVIQHYRALPGGPGESFDYGADLVGAILERLAGQIDRALTAGVARDRIIIDPGLGFSLTSDQCREIVASMGRLTSLGYPVLIGASRKRFVAEEGPDTDATTERITRACAAAGMWGVRVHDAARNARAVRGGRAEGE